MARRCRPLQLLACLTSLTSLTYTHAQRGSCSHEGQPPCRGDDGLTTLSPEADANGDGCIEFHTPSPDDYHLSPEDLCTHCGGLFEPPCHYAADPSDTPQLECGSDSIDDDLVVEDGRCVPNPNVPGCGTHGRAPCPPDVKGLLGPGPFDWTLNADGCVYSVLEEKMRFTLLPEALLPPNKKCAKVCVACGLAGMPWCPTEPKCVKAFNEGIQYMPDQYKPGYCKNESSCGTDTTEPCPPGELTLGDKENDGCFDSFELTNGACVARPTGQLDQSPYAWPWRIAGSCEPGLYPQTDPSRGIPICKAYCPECKVDTSMPCPIGHERAPQSFVDANPGVQVAQCVPCGALGQPFCVGIPNGGCTVNLGLVPNTVTGICEEAACGREGLPPFGEACPGTAPDFVVPDSGCLPGHHLRNGRCTSCGMAIPDSAEGFSLGLVKCDYVGCEYTIQFQIEFQGAYSHVLEAGQIPSGQASRCISDVDLTIQQEAIPSYPRFTEHGECTEVCSQGFQNMFQQCGGDGWTGSTCCDRLTTCESVNPGYSHCNPTGCAAARDGGEQVVCLGDQCSGTAYTGLQNCESGSFCQNVDASYGVCTALALQTNIVDDQVYKDAFVRHDAVPFENACPFGGTPVQRYEQCDGPGYQGPTCCYGYNVCLVDEGEDSRCLPATLPEGMLAYGAKCSLEDDRCELGSQCMGFDNDLAICEPLTQIASSSSERSPAFIAGMVVLALFLLLACCGCVRLCQIRYRKNKFALAKANSGRITQRDAAQLMRGTKRSTLLHQSPPSLQNRGTPGGTPRADEHIPASADSFTVHSVVWGNGETGDGEVTPKYSMAQNVIWERP